MIRQGRIATPDRRATRVGQDVLDAGGTAVDAVIAASAVLCVVYPQNVTLGGDTWTLVDGPDTGPVAVDGTGAAPAALSAEILRDRGLDRVPGTGPDSVTVPGLVAAWGDLHAGDGRTPFAELLAPARDLADRGSPVATATGRDLAQLADALRADPGCASVFFHDDGSVLAAGDLLVQPALADTLDQLAANGPAALYGGDVGRRYVAGLQTAGSLIGPGDLARHRTRRVRPLTGTHAGLDVLTSPPSSQGFTLLKILALLAGMPAADPFIPERAAEVLRAVVLAGRERDGVLADPEHVGSVTAAVTAVLDPATTARQAAAIRAGEDGDPAVGAPCPPLGGDTIGIVAVDQDGCWVSSVQSVAGTFGSRLLEPSTGILAHNRGSGFSLDPTRPDALAGGRRPPHTLMPALVRRDGRTVGALATMGGKSQPFILTQVLGRLLAGDHPQDAVAAPRWVVHPSAGTDRGVVADSRLGSELQAALGAAGDIEVVDHQDNRLGHCQVLWTADGDRAAGSDPRADGAAVPH